MSDVPETPPERPFMPDQRSLTDQLADLYVLANRWGLYDAADWLKAGAVVRSRRQV